jgi:hypothetical protein
MGVGDQRQPRLLYPQERKLATHYKAGLAGQGPVWTGAEDPRPCRDVGVTLP